MSPGFGLNSPIWSSGAGLRGCYSCVSTVGPSCHVGSSSCVASFARVGPFDRVELCNCVSTLGLSSRVEPFGHVRLCGCVELFGRVGPIGHVGLSSRVGPSGHVGQFGRVEPFGLVRFVVLVSTLKGWFGCLATCAGNDLSIIHGRFPILIDSLNQCRFLVV